MDWKKLNADLFRACGYVKFGISSYIRDDGSHSTGKAVDLVIKGIGKEMKPVVNTEIYKDIIPKLWELRKDYRIQYSFPNNVHIHIQQGGKGFAREYWHNGENFLTLECKELIIDKYNRMIGFIDSQGKKRRAWTL